MEIDLGHVLDALPAMVWTALPDGHIDFVNRRWSEYTGLSLDEAHGWDWQAAVDPDDLPKLLERWRSILASGEPGELEARVRRFDGQYRWYLVHCNPMSDDAGRIVKWCGTATDVDDFRRAEETLRRRELDFQLIVDSIPIPVAVTTPSGEVEGLNQLTLDYFGKTFEELKGWKASEVVHPDDLERTVAAQLEAHQQGHSYNVESRHRRADGVYRWYNVLGLPLRDPQGNILRWFHLLIDIDDRRRAEEALRQSEAQLAEAERDLRLTIDTIPVFVSAYQPDGTRSFVNRTWQDHMGLTLEEVTGDGATTFPHFHPDDAERNDKAWRASLVSGEPLTIEVRVRCADGQYRWHKSLRVPLRDEKGRIVRWYSVSIDIDDQKRAEEALVASEREARLIVNSIPAGLEILGPTGTVEAINEPVVRYFGRTSEELKRRGIADFIHPEDLQNVLDTALHSTTTGAPYDAEQRFRGADGTYRWFQVRGLPLRDVTGRIVRWYALHIDIDDRKRAEEALLASERKLDLIINTIPALAWSARTDGTAEFFNQHYLDYIGLSAEQAQGWGWTAAAHPDDLNGLATMWQAIMASGKLGETEARLRRHDGEYRWFLFRANPLRDEAGSIVKWYGVNTDIEDRKRAEEALSESERYSRLIVDSIPATVTAHTPDGELEFANRQVLEYFGKTLEEIKHWKTEEITHPEDLPRAVELFSQSIASGAPFDFEVRARRFDGVYRWLQTRGLPLRDADGRIVRWYNLLIDIDERKRAEEALSKARSELAHVARVTSLGALTASIAHEVNQPLSGIITNASTCLRMLAADPPNIDVAQETARRTIRDGNRAADVIARLRALFSRKNAAIEPVDLNEAVREVIALSWGDLQRSRVVLRTELADGLPPVGGDRVQLQQVIMNLLRNAADAMSEIDDRPRRVVIRTDSDSGQVRLSVEDNGIGFGPDGPERLFETFYTTKSDGMGIGLSVSRSIIESHRGRLWAVSNDGPGATFSFSIPEYSGEEIPVREAGALHTPVACNAQSSAGIS